MPATTTGPLVGRTEELRRLADLVGIAGRAERAVLLSGDAGVGKSRLIRELSEQAREAGWRVMLGHCLDFGDSTLPYLPFSEAFGRLAGDDPDTATALVEASPAIARLLPARRMLADTGGTVEPTDRAALFEAVHRGLEELGRDRPLLLVVEDIHWADQSTRDLLTFLFTRGFASPVCVLASYRSDDLHRRHPLRTTLAQWARLPGVARLHLAPLAGRELRALVHALHPDPLPELAVQDIVDRAEGNPFFVEELVATADLDRRLLPAALADVLLVRLDQLDEAARLVVRAASVVGRQVSHALLAQGTTLDATALDAALRSAVESNVLVPVATDGYAFRHALLAEAVYQDLIPGERVRLHAAYARALAAGEVAGTAAELARHARAAHDLVTAARAGVQAGDEAMAVGGPDEAARHYESALELVSDPEVAAAIGVDTIDLTLRAASAATAAGHPFRAVALAEGQLRALPIDAPPLDRARLLHAVAAAALLTDSKLDVLALTTEAIGLVPPEHPGPLRAQLLTAHARAAADRSRHEDAGRWAEEALALARQRGLPDVAADAATTLARLEERTGDPEASQAALLTAVAEARAAGEIAAEMRSLFNLGSLHYEFGRLAEAFEAYQQTWQRARDVGRPWAPYGLDARAMSATVAYDLGDWSQCLQILDVGGESPPPLAEAQLAAVGMDVAAGRGEVAALELMAWLRSAWHRDGLVAITSGAAALDLLGQHGDVVAASQMYDEVVASVSALWQRPAFQARIRLGALLLGHLADAAGHAESARRSDLVRHGDELAAATEDVAEQGVSGGRQRGLESGAWLARLRAERARLHWLSGIDPLPQDEIIGLWREAVAGFERFGHVYETARSRARLAAVLRAAGEVDAAASLVAEVRRVALDLGATPLLDEVRELGAPPAPAPARSAPDRLDEPLTARERDVLALVAQGRSNREIAAQLFISAKTVSVHVSNILAKLGAGGRTEAVAIARRRGLLLPGTP